jgi:WD40 repeat protein
VSGSNNKTIKIWDAETGQAPLTLRGHASTVYSVAFSPDGKRIVSGSLDKTIKIWDSETGEHERTLQGYAGPVYGVAFFPDGKQIVSGHDSRVYAWDLETAR